MSSSLSSRSRNIVRFERITSQRCIIANLLLQFKFQNIDYSWESFPLTMDNVLNDPNVTPTDLDDIIAVQGGLIDQLVNSARLTKVYLESM